jgi:hypothetical protein
VAEAPQPFLNVTMEDSFMWRDEHGHFHVTDAAHAQRSPRAAVSSLRNSHQRRSPNWLAPGAPLQALFHSWAPVEVGAHTFSRDGLHWTLSTTRAFGTIVQTTDGHSVQYGRRERPHLLLDERQRPTHLLTAVEYGALGTSDFSHVHVQAIVSA